MRLGYGHAPVLIKHHTDPFLRRLRHSAAAEIFIVTNYESAVIDGCYLYAQFPRNGFAAWCQVVNAPPASTSLVS